MASNAFYTCPKCDGLGRISCFANVLGGVCFSCAGSGKKKGKAPVASPDWAGFLVELSTGNLIRFYNVKAKSQQEAKSKIAKMFERSSLKANYSLEGGLVIRWSDLEDPDAVELPGSLMPASAG